jgi:hypothetical protein
VHVGVKQFTETEAVKTIASGLRKGAARPLKEDPEAPWAGWGGRPDGLTAMKLGQMLKDFDIRSAMIRFPAEDYPGVGQARGYRRTDFIDAWDRYCPPPDVTDSDVEDGPDALVIGLDGTTEGAEPHQAVPALTCTGTPGTAGTASPPKPAVCIVCREPLTFDDGTHAHPVCIPA